MHKTPFSPKEKSIINLYVIKSKNGIGYGGMISEVQMINPSRSRASIRTKFHNELCIAQGKPPYWKSKKQATSNHDNPKLIDTTSELLSPALKVAIDMLPKIIEENSALKA